MSNIRERAALVDKVAAAMGKKVYSGETPKNTTFRKDLQKVQSKVVTLEDAIRLSGLKDGMTISFHHHFRGGDKVVNMVVGKLAEMGFKNLHLAASSLSDVHAPLIDHIKNGATWRACQGDLTRSDEGACGVPQPRRTWKRHRQR